MQANKLRLVQIVHFKFHYYHHQDHPIILIISSLSYHHHHHHLIIIIITLYTRRRIRPISNISAVYYPRDNPHYLRPLNFWPPPIRKQINSTQTLVNLTGGSQNKKACAYGVVTEA